MNFHPDEPIFPPGIPDEFKKQIQEYHSHTRARMQDNTHAVRQLLDELDSDQLTALEILVIDITTNAKRSGGYWRGQINALQWARNSVCPCGESHDPDAEFEMTSPERPLHEKQVKGRSIEDVELPDDGPLYQQIITLADNEQVIVGSERWDELMDLYTLKVFDTQMDGAMFFECTNCGKQYPSLQDRMLKATCGGCAHKEKWG